MASRNRNMEEENVASKRIEGEKIEGMITKYNPTEVQSNKDNVYNSNLKLYCLCDIY